MNLEERVKEHIKDLRRRIKANILADVRGRVRHAISQQNSTVFTVLQLTLSGLAGTVQSLFSAKARKQKLPTAASLFANTGSADRITNNILSLLVGASVELSHCECDTLYTGILDSPNFP